jgi:hypothetical protein
VVPKEAALKEAESTLKEAKETLAIKQAELKEVTDKVAELERALKEALDKKESLKNQVLDCEAKLVRAHELIKGMGGEKFVGIPKIHTMPIGIKDCEKVVPNHKGFSHDYLYDEGLKIADKEYLCLLCFSFTHYERNDCYNALNKCKFITNIIDSGYAEEYLSGFVKKIPTWINFDFLHKSYYTLSPRGAGEDCHRFYEAIYLDSIPIVKRTNTHFDKLYDIFPCLIINNWEEVTEDLLIQNKDKYMNKIKEFKTKYPNAFTDINSIHELLLQT